MTNDRPKRKAIPVSVKRAVVARQGGLCVCGCGQPVSWKPKSSTHFDHEPALRLRNINADGTDYDPPQHDARHIDVRCPESHHAKTHGTGSTVAGTDTGKIKKERKRAKPKREYRWPSRDLQSRGFDKRHRPMNRRKK